MTRAKAAKPFLKWAGGKRQLLAQFDALFPSRRRYKRYLEPFVGGGAVFFHLAPRDAVLSDANEELVECYRAIRDHVDAVIGHLREAVASEAEFYRVRSLDPGALEPARRAARTIYLNRTCFNGLYRVNGKGQFNVPFGRYEAPVLCDAANLRAVSGALRGVRLDVRPFERVLDDARRGDFVYLDPPYQPLSTTASFTSYTRTGFSMKDQQRLAQVYAELSKRGCLAMLSNSDTPLVRELYESLGNRRVRLLTVSAGRAINSRADRRGPVRELVVVNYSCKSQVTSS